MIRYCVYSLSLAGARKYRGCFRDKWDASIWARRWQFKWVTEGFSVWDIQPETR